MGDKLATKIMDNTEASKQRPLSRVIFALGILHVGSEMAELLVQHYPSMDRLSTATQGELTSVPGIGPKIASSIVAYFDVERNVEVIEKLRRAGVSLAQAAPAEGRPAIDEGRELPLVGHSFVITGTLASMTRSRAEACIKELGGSISPNVTRKTNYLVLGAEPGSKLEAATRLGTALLKEEEFLELIGSSP